MGCEKGFDRSRRKAALAHLVRISVTFSEWYFMLHLDDKDLKFYFVKL